MTSGPSAGPGSTASASISSRVNGSTSSARGSGVAGDVAPEDRRGKRLAAALEGREEADGGDGDVHGECGRLAGERRPGGRHGAQSALRDGVAPRQVGQPVKLVHWIERSVRI